MNRRLNRREPIPGGDIIQFGLINFSTDHSEDENSLGYLRIPYICLLLLCNSYAANLFEKLKLADYGALHASYMTPGNLGWENFERLLR